MFLFLQWRSLSLLSFMFHHQSFFFFSKSRVSQQIKQNQNQFFFFFKFKLQCQGREIGHQMIDFFQVCGAQCNWSFLIFGECYLCVMCIIRIYGIWGVELFYIFLRRAYRSQKSFRCIIHNLFTNSVN